MELYKAINCIQLKTLELKNKVALMLKKIITTLLLQMEGLTLLFFLNFLSIWILLKMRKLC